MPELDADFSMAPAFVPGDAHTPFHKDVVTLGQKNSNLYALDADNARVHFTATNCPNLSWKLVPSKTTNRSGFGALDLRDGEVAWSIATPMVQDKYLFVGRGYKLATGEGHFHMLSVRKFNCRLSQTICYLLSENVSTSASGAVKPSCSWIGEQCRRLCSLWAL
jgi:hypothetical protein